MAIFILLATEFFVRYAANRPARPDAGGARAYGGAMHPRVKLMAAGASTATLFLFVRAVYRLFELADGWNGPINSTQWYFSAYFVPPSTLVPLADVDPCADLFDGGMITLCLYTLAFFHPGRFLFAVPDGPAAEGEPKLQYARFETVPMQRV